MDDLKIGKSSGELYVPKPRNMTKFLTNMLIVICLAIAFFFFFGCSDSVNGPYNQTYGLKYDKLFDQPTTPPSRPPLPCGYYVVNDSTWGYDLHADTCN